jgi:periplasmic protein TonB
MLIVFSIAGLIALLAILDHLMSNNWSGLTSKNRNETVFSSRKKDYGAYQLRVDYSKRLLAILLFIGIGIGGISAASLAFLKPKIVVDKTNDRLRADVFKPIDDKLPVIEIPEEKGGAAPVDPLVFPEPVVSDDPVVDPIVIPDDGQTIVDHPVNPNSDGDGFDTKPIGDGPGGGIIDKPELPDNNEYNSAELDEFAIFPGGFGAMKEFIAENIRTSNIEGSGKVFVKFLVEKDGTISKVLKYQDNDDCYGCMESAIRVVRDMPKWTPAKKNGVPVRAWQSLPIVINSGM